MCCVGSKPVNTLAFNPFIGRYCVMVKFSFIGTGLLSLSVSRSSLILPVGLFAGLSLPPSASLPSLARCLGVPHTVDDINPALP